MIMAGGTGGHVYPALSVAEHLRDQGIEIVWLGTRKGLEARVVPAAGFQMEWLEIKGLVGSSWMRKAMMPWMLLRALIQALRITRRRMPDAVLGMGGFAAGPGGLAAWLLRRPLVIHEANAVCGVTNRLLAPLSKRVLTGFENVRHLGASAKCTGNPVRQEIVRSRVAEDSINVAQPLRVLVLGGSQGARSINDLVPAALVESQFNSRLTVTHQCGRDREDEVNRAYADVKVPARVGPFIDDMSAAYRQADLVIARSGAMTVTELCATGLASILLPFPFAASNHQAANAQALSSAGAAVVIEASMLDAQRLAKEIDRLLKDRSLLTKMGHAAHELARPDATANVAGCCLELAHA
jgi:UDP-N-acetylglucosamine--N-acetylmuramyl-(pentapeptide) pyrophosphoryl-undecaprenol N-acetylglucosamine transferase